MNFTGSDLLAAIAADDLVLDERGLLVTADEADSYCDHDGADAKLRIMVRP
jgi:hypothetical protein